MIKPQQIIMDIIYLLKKHGQFSSDEELKKEVDKLSKTVLKNLIKLPPTTPKEFYKKAYESMLNTIELSLTGK